METAQIKSEFEQILADVVKVQGLPIDSAVDVAKVILQESGKDRRTLLLNQFPKTGNGSGGASDNGNTPATDSQKDFMRKLKISFGEEISKAEASKLIDEAIQKKNGKK